MNNHLNKDVSLKKRGRINIGEINRGTQEQKQENNLTVDFPGGTVGKNPPANAGDTGLIPGLRRFHMPQNNYAPPLQLLRPHAATTEAQAPRACAPQQEKPPQ